MAVDDESLQMLVASLHVEQLLATLNKLEALKAGKRGKLTLKECNRISRLLDAVKGDPPKHNVCAPNWSLEAEPAEKQDEMWSFIYVVCNDESTLEEEQPDRMARMQRRSAEIARQQAVANGGFGRS